MKFLFDLFPVILFFAVFKWGEGHEQAAHGIVLQFLGGLMSGGAVASKVAPVILATVVAIVATAVQIAYLKLRGKKVDGMLWVAAAVITIMGGATIYLHDETFIKWKPTILYWTFAAILLFYKVFMGKNLMRSVLGEAFKLPEEVWPRVCFAWIWFLFALGLLNLLMAFVIFKGNTSAWVNFKVFGATGIFFAFTVLQAFVLSKYLMEEEA